MVVGQFTLKIKGFDFCIIGEDGKFKYNKEKINDLKKLLAEEQTSFENMDLPDFEQFIDLDEQAKEQEQIEKTQGKKPEPEQDDEKPEEEKDKEKKEELEKRDENDENQQRQTIAAQLGISPDKIYFIKPDSQFYKNHPGMFQGKNNFFYEDSKGVYRAGRIDKSGKAVEDKEHFSSNQIKKMQPVIRRGDGREDVKKQIPIQTISMINPAKENSEKDVQDRYIAVFKGNGGYAEFDEVEQPRGKSELPVSERIEISSRRNNTQEINKAINNRRSDSTPSKIAQNYEIFEDSEKAADGLQPNEVLGELEEHIRADLIKTRGPMPEEQLESMIEEAIELINNGENYDDAIAQVGVIERKPGGRTPGEGSIDKRGV